MKKILILPNYLQSDDITVLHSDGGGWSISAYSHIIGDLKLPKGCGRGIPSAVLNRHKEKDFVLGQLICHNGHPSIFLKSCRAGVDKTGRGVFITAIWQDSLLIPSNKDNFFLDFEEIKHQIYANNNDYKDEYISNIENSMDILNNIPKSHAHSIDKMWNNCENYKNYNHFTSVSLKGAGYLPGSEGDIFSKKKFHSRNGMPKPLLIALLLIIVAFSAFYYVTFN